MVSVKAALLRFTILSLPDIHILHTHDHVVVFIEEGTIECDDIIGVAAMHNLELTHDASSHLLLGFDMNDLVNDNIFVSRVLAMTLGKA